MRFEIPLTLFAEERPAVMVVSHERSGTHFLMNSLAHCYGYTSLPWVNLDDHDVSINFFYPLLFRELLMRMAAYPMANVVKSHHPVEFLGDELATVTKRFVIFIMCRDPAGVMLSYWRFMHRWPWNEGPKVADPFTFARSEPCGRMMRYQPRQYPNLLQRWAAHVEGWLAAAEGNPRLAVVRYEDLNSRYEETMQGLASLLGRPPQALSRPAPDDNIIPGGPPDPMGMGVPPDVEGLRWLCREEVGETMKRLGY
jgi:hypothetical protein